VEALQVLLGQLPKDLDAAVLIVLHMPAYQRSDLDGILQRSTKLHVHAAADGELLQNGHIYTAVPDHHLTVNADRIQLTRGPKECRVRPAVDVLFRSAALAFGPRVLGVVLTGALDDGTAGLWAIKRQGGQALVQDPGTALHPSMPESARTNVDVDAVLSLEALGGELVRRLLAMDDGLTTMDPARSLQVETLIAAEGNGLQAGVMNLGEVSKYTCPDCHGVLVEIVEGSIVRFRCHTGHAFSMKTLLLEVDESIELALWSTLRAIEERVMLLRRMAALARERGDEVESVASERQASEADRRGQAIRQMVLDPETLGRKTQEPVRAQA
jgi:two-component system chemotaxis response regulator CheB